MYDLFSVPYLSLPYLVWTVSALRSGSSAGAHGIAGGSTNPHPQQQAAGQGQVTLRQLQEVFSSSLVSSASLDYLAISTIIDDDFADIR